MQPLLLLAVIVALAWSSWIGLTAAEPTVRWRDGQYQTADGKSVALRGVNLGGWLLLEPWKLRIEGIPDQERLLRQLTGKISAPWAADFRRRLKAAWLRAEDLAVVKAVGWNTVRIPFDSRPLIAEQEPVAVPPNGPGPKHWIGSDIGFASSGGEEVMADGNWRLVSAGHELFQNHDAFRFLHQSSPGGTFFATVVIKRLEAVHRFTKGGLMLRRSAGADAPFACVHALPDGGVRFLKAAQAQGGAEESPILPLKFPIELRLTAKAGQVTGEARSGQGPWTKLGDMPQWHSV